MSKASASGSSDRTNSVPWKTNMMVTLVSICRDLDHRSTGKKKQCRDDSWWHEAAQRFMELETNVGHVTGNECEIKFAEIEEKYNERLNGNTCRFEQLEAFLAEAEPEQAVELPQLPQVQQQDQNAVDVDVSSARWTAMETHVFIQLYVELENKVPSSQVWDCVSARMQGLEFNRSPMECEEKWSTLLVTYQKLKTAKKNHRKRAEDIKCWPFFRVLEAIHVIRRGKTPGCGNGLDILLDAIDFVSSMENTE